MNKRIRGQTGDTLVEVLMAVIILGAVIGGAYATANRAVLAERNTQEHTDALTIAQAQVEALYAGNTLQPGDNCFNTSNGYKAMQGVTTGPHGVGEPSHYCYADSSGSYANTFNGTTCPAGNAFCYQVTDLPLSSTTLPNHTVTETYEVEVNWPSLNGGRQSTSSVQLYYRPQ